MTVVTIENPGPVLSWAGNKFGTPVAKRVKELYEPYRDRLWIEPFVGAGGMLLSVQPDRAVCLDINPVLIGLHRWIRDGGECIKFPETHTQEDYKAQRARFNELKSQYEASPDFVDEDVFFSLLIWINKACFNGLYRENSKGLFNVPVGRNSKGAIKVPQTPNLSEVRSFYKEGWEFRDGSFEMATCYNDTSNHVIYADPPYWGTHSDYEKNGFSFYDQSKLCYWLAAQRKPVIASNSSHGEIVAMYKDAGFTIEFIEVRRSISCKGKERKSAIEMLAHKGF